MSDYDLLSLSLGKGCSLLMGVWSPPVSVSFLFLFTLPQVLREFDFPKFLPSKFSPPCNLFKILLLGKIQISSNIISENFHEPELFVLHHIQSYMCHRQTYIQTSLTNWLVPWRISMFDVVRSPWMRPPSCSFPIASPICTAISSIRSSTTVFDPKSRKMSLTAGPSTYSNVSVCSTGSTKYKIGVETPSRLAFVIHLASCSKYQLWDNSIKQLKIIRHHHIVREFINLKTKQ